MIAWYANKLLLDGMFACYCIESVMSTAMACRSNQLTVLQL